MAAQTQVTVRFPPEVLERIDSIAELLSKFGTQASRADAVRFIVAKGIDAAEAELAPRKGRKP